MSPAARRSFTKVELLVVIIIIVILMACLGFGQPFFVLLFGWVIFPIRTIPHVTVDWLACSQAAVAVVVTIPATHFFLRWLYGQARPAEGGEPPRCWKFRWTLFSLVGVVFLFVAGIAVVGLVHQVGWLYASDDPWITSGGVSAARRSQSSNNLKQIGLGFHAYHDEHETFAPGGTFNDYGEMQHGWVTSLLPHIEYGRLEIDFSVPWDHPNNREALQTRVDPVENPAIRRADSNGLDGYAPAHYAANSRLAGGGPPMPMDDVTDGTTNTILAGEIVEGFRPWGHPLNWRDPAVGLNKPGGFGSPYSSGVTQFIMADGSFHALTADVDPSVLRALATPAGGETVDDSEW